MHRDETGSAAHEWHEPSPLPRDRHASPSQGAAGGCSQRDGELRLDLIQFALNPPSAMVDLGIVGRLVNTALTARLVFEVLDRVGDVNARAVYVSGKVTDSRQG